MAGPPRPHAYLFAHRTMPHLVHDEWPTLRTALSSDTASDRIRWAWVTAGEVLPEADRLPPAGLRVERMPLGAGGAFLVVFPTPEGAVEASLAIIPDRPAPTRYFVLELGIDIGTEDRAWVLCEWSDGRHVNFGRCGGFVTTDPTNVVVDMRDRVVAILEEEASTAGGDGPSG